MASHWNDNQPIYNQLRDEVVAMALEGTLADGDLLHSARGVAAPTERLGLGAARLLAKKSG